MSEVPERGSPETRMKVLPDFSLLGFGIGTFAEQNLEPLFAFWDFREIEKLFALRVASSRARLRPAAVRSAGLQLR